MFREQSLRQLLRGKRMLIAGYGREGHSVDTLARQLSECASITIAMRINNGQWQDMQGQWHSDWPFDLTVKSPGIPLSQMGNAPGITSLTDLFLQVYADRVIGITGTKGKSTTASLIAHLLPDSLLAGNIGVPLFDIIDRMTPDTIVVAELSCHQLEGIHRSPHIGIILNLFQEHLDHYPSYLDYKMAKLQIGLHQQPSDHLFYCTDNAELVDLVSRLDLPGQLHPYASAPSSLRHRALLAHCPLVGDHNKGNALVATLVAQLMGQPDSSIAQRLASFRGLAHRLEPVPSTDGILWFDDSISTIPEATCAAISALGSVDTLILGGMDRGIDYSPLVAMMQRNKVANIAFVGAAGRRIHRLFRDAGIHCNTLLCDNYATIVDWCAKRTPLGGKVLLSPAAASYDSFRNFEERGDCFRQLILQLHNQS